MHKQFQKFGLFAFKNQKDEADPKIDDKYVKYLYRKETESVKRKIKSANDTENEKFGKRQSQETKSRHHKKIPDDPFRKLLRKNNVSETEIFFISPEEIKRHRKKLRQSREKSSEGSPHRRKRSTSRVNHLEPEKKKTQKKEDDIAKFIKEHKYKGETDCQWLIKPDMYKLLSNPKEEPKTSSASNFLKKFFVFDRDSKDKADFIPVHHKHSKKSHKLDEDNRNKQPPPFIASGSSTVYKKEKRIKEHDKKNRDKSIDVMYTRESKNKTERNKSVSKERGEKQKRSIKTKEKLDDPIVLEVCHNKDIRRRRAPSKSRAEKKPDVFRIETEAKCTKLQEKSVELKKKILDEKKQNVCNINRERHKKCLVKHTFPIVEIHPFTPPHDSTLEKKKRLKAFKKYYRYNFADKDSEITTSSNGYAFSDSHKMYQDVNEPDELLKKKLKHEKAGSHRGSDLKIETNVSSIIIDPEPQKIAEVSNNTEEKKRKKHFQKSKIPIFNNNHKIVDLARSPSPASKSRRNSADLFKPKNTNVEESGKEETTKSRIPVSKSFNEKCSVDEKTKITKIPKYQSTAAQNNIVIKTKEKSTTPKMDSNDLKLSGISSGSKLSYSDKNSIDSRKRTVSPSPLGTYRKRTNGGSQKGVKSPSKLCQDGVSSVWSRNSKKSAKSTFSSKSDTRIPKNKRAMNQQKGKAFDRSSARTSISNSTCGDKSIDSKNGTSFLLTKSYRDDDKLSRWQKRKMYADIVRKNAISKSQKTSVVPPQIVEIRYFTTVTTDADQNKAAEEKEGCSTEESTKQSAEVKNDDLIDDMPNPCFELVEDKKFKEIFELAPDEALNEILNENYSFLQKDFSFNLDEMPKLSSSSDDITSNDLASARDSNEWYDFKIHERESLSELSCCRKKSDLVPVDINLGSEEQIVDSLSAPGSEESGYATVKTRSFFERPHIKALIHPTKHTTLDCNTEIVKSSKCDVEIRSIESKSLQTYMIATTHKSVQIKLSPEEIDFSEPNQDKETTTRKENVEEVVVSSQRGGECEDSRKEAKLESPVNQQVGTLEHEEEVEISNYFYEDESVIIKQEAQLKLTQVKERKKSKKFVKLLSSLSCIGCRPSRK